MNTEETIVPVGDSHVAVQEYGDPAGHPVIFCHGWPSSRTMAELTDQIGREVGARLISPDRPGISRSPIQPERKLADWPAVVDAIANHFGVGEFRVLGISGGAPYAFVSGWAMPQRAKAIAVVSGAPPISELMDHGGLLPLYRWMLWLYRRQPELLRFFFRVVRPFASLRSSVQIARGLTRFLQPCDAESLRDQAAFNACFESQRRAWRGSAEGVMMDAQIYAEPWGFRLEEITVPVRLWHGQKDRSFSVRVAEEVAARLPNCTARYVENAGHYSLPIRHMREILVDLLSAGTTGQ